MSEKDYVVLIAAPSTTWLSSDGDEADNNTLSRTTDPDLALRFERFGDARAAARASSRRHPEHNFRVDVMPPDEATAPVNGIPSTLRHDEGAISRCYYCRRYSLDPATLSDRQPICDCGKRHGWSGSFEVPNQDAQWSGQRPQVERHP